MNEKSKRRVCKLNNLSFLERFDSAYRETRHDFRQKIQTSPVIYSPLIRPWWWRFFHVFRPQPGSANEPHGDRKRRRVVA